VTTAVLADENFPLPVIDGLSAAGYDVMSIAQTCPGINDREVLDLACRTGRRLLTFDGDFGDLVFFHGVQPPVAILYFRLHPIVTEEVLVTALRALAEVPDGHFAVVTPENTRLRPLANKAVP
jgi:predicted nuclease of predicted toxin-antitoxin system